MLRALEDVLNLPESKSIIQEEIQDQIDDQESDQLPMITDISQLDQIAAALPTVKGLGDASDREFDELAKRATQAYDDLMDFGFNVEARYSSRIFEVAGGMLKNAIEAKSAKIDKKLRMIDLQLKKQRLDQVKPKDDLIEGEGVVITDRNSLLESLKTKKTK